MKACRIHHIPKTTATNRSKTMQKQTTSEYETLATVYELAASDLHSAQSSLGDYSDELWAFLDAREALENHADFTGVLPTTYFY